MLHYIQHIDALLDGKRRDEKEEKIQGKSCHLLIKSFLMYPLALTDSDIQILKTYVRCIFGFLPGTVRNTFCRVKVHTLPS